MPRMRLDVKLIFSFLIIATIAGIIGVIGFLNLGTMRGHVQSIGDVQLPTVEKLSVIQNSLTAIKVATRTLMDPSLGPDDFKRQFENIAKQREIYQKASNTYAALKKGPEEEGMWKEFLEKVAAWRDENNKLMELAKTVQALDAGNPDQFVGDLKGFIGDHYKVMAMTDKMITTQKVFEGGTDATACNLGKWVAQYKTSNGTIRSMIEDIHEPHHKFHQTVAKIKEEVKAGNLEEARRLNLEVLGPAMEAEVKAVTALYEEAKKAKNAFDQMRVLAMTSVRDTQDACIKVVERLLEATEIKVQEAGSSAKRDSSASQIIMLVVVVIGVILALVLGVMIALSITKPIARIISSLNEGADQTAAASGQVSSAAQQLSQGATEAAASLEETSSSLDEMNSMTKQNADNASKANQLAQEARSSADQGNVAMTEMQSAIGAMRESSDKISKIIKTIEEIAFQTNLLALNAAVEAARAGEHGKGFAVVAEEVRNLAKRSASAAKDTADLIEDNISKSKNGTGIAKKAGESLISIIERTKKVADIISEIAAASKEQAEGLNQITNAVSQLDQVTQQNAAAAEEAASSSEELNSQADALKGTVSELQRLISGQTEDLAQKLLEAQSGRGQFTHRQAPIGHLPKIASRKTASASKDEKNLKKNPKPEDTIPLDDDKLKQF